MLLMAPPINSSLSIFYNICSMIFIMLELVIAVALEGNRRDCNTMEKQRGRR
jgi:hypothetical protein